MREVNHDIVQGFIHGRWPVNSVDLAHILRVHNIEPALPYLNEGVDFVRVPGRPRQWLTCAAAVQVAVFLVGGRAAADVATWLAESGRDDGRPAAASL